MSRMTGTKLPRIFFTPTRNGARIHLRGCSFHMTDAHLQALVDWLLDGRPDPTPERRRIAAEYFAEREQERSGE